MSRERHIIYLAGFLFSLPIALASYINSSFLSEFVGEKLAGIVYTFGAVASFAALLSIPQIFRKVGGYKSLLAVILLDMLTFFALVVTRHPAVVVIFFVLGMTLNTLIVFSLDEILKIFSKDAGTGSIRGTYLTVCNMAWILSQILNASILGNITFEQIYLVSGLVMFIFFLLAFFKLKGIKDPSYDDTKTLRAMKEFFKHKKLLHAYGINFILQFFFCVMVIYTPIYLSTHLGFSWKDISTIFAFMLLPFSILPIRLGRYADKIGERTLLILGFTITTLATVMLFFVTSSSLFIWAVLLFSTRIGASIVESMSDVYFFKHIKPENEEFIGIYRTASPVAYVICPLVAFIALLYIPAFNYLFLLLGAVTLTGTYLSSLIKTSDI